MNLIFLHSDGSKTVVSKMATKENVYTKIKEFVAELNPDYKISYFREWQELQGIIYDVGSHSEFFLLEGVEADD